MGRDFKIGLMSGVVLGFVALIWVATRPSQSPQARLQGSSMTASQEGRTTEGDSSPLQKQAPTSPTRTVSSEEDTVPPGSGADQPDSAERLFLPEQPSEIRQPAPRASETSETSREESPEKITTTRFHIVQPSETLSGIAQQYYGSASRWRTILEANRETIKDPDRISPGTKLVIPW